MSEPTTPTPDGPPEHSRRRRIVAVIGLLVLVAVVGLTWWIDGRTEPSDAAPTPSASASFAESPPLAASTTSSTPGSRSTTSKRPQTSSTTTKSNARIPARVRDTLEYIDAGQWPDAANAPGTHGGDRFRNNERRLPTRSANGKPITYREWDVNPKQRGRGRDAERIITGSDGSAYYTLDHYATFTLIRGPSR